MSSKKSESKAKEEKAIEQALANTDIEAKKLPDDKKLKTRGGYSSTKYKKYLELGVMVDTTTKRLEQYIEQRNSLFFQLKDTEEFKAMEFKKQEIPFDSVDTQKAA